MLKRSGFLQEGKTIMKKFLGTFALVLSFFASSGLAQTGHHVYVLNKQSASMTIIDAASLEVRATIAVGQQPHELAIDPAGDKAYVSNVGDSSISVVDLAGQQETKTITTPDFSFPHGIAFTPDARIAVVTSELTQKIVIIDAERDTLLRSIDTPEEGTHMVVIDRTGRWAYFSNRDSNTVSIMDLTDYSLVANIPVGDGAEGIALSPDGKYVWVGNRRANTATVVDTESRRVVGQVPTGDSPIRAAFSPDGTRVYIPNAASDDISVYDAESHELLNTISVGGNPGGIVFSDDGSKAYVASAAESAVYVVDTRTLEVSGKVDVGRGPDGITYR